MYITVSYGAELSEFLSTTGLGLGFAGLAMLTLQDNSIDTEIRY